MRYVGIDASLNSTGIAIIDENEKLLLSHTIYPDIKQTPFKRIIQTISELRLFLEGDDIGCIVIEDTFLGHNFVTAKNALALMGCIRYDYWLRKKEEIIPLMAVTARKLCNINARCHKAEVQFYVMEIYNIGEESFRKDIKERILKVNNIKDKKLKIYLMHKINKDIEKTLNLTEHEADSVILALSAKRYKEALIKLSEDDNRLKEDTKIKISKSISKKWKNKKYRIRMIKSMKGRIGSFLGKNHSKITKEKMSLKKKGISLSYTHKKNISKGIKRYNETQRSYK